MTLGIIFKAPKYILVIPHLAAYFFTNSSSSDLIDSDITEMNHRLKQKHGLAYYLVYHKPYRNLFYHRVKGARFLRLILPEYPMFSISSNAKIGGCAYVLNHPYGTIINAKSIGSNFTICHLTTIGNSQHGRNDLIPTIGNNVSIGANATIIGSIVIGDNVMVGAGSVVVHDVPSNCIIAGNPAQIIRTIE